MQQAPVQVTVVEYVNEFFQSYLRRSYGKGMLVNASRGAETLMGMLKLVLSRGGRDELRMALHCFKDQLIAATNSPVSVQQQRVDEVFALLSALVDAAERLRQFSPVKEQLSTSVLEEVRFRLYRIIVGEGFCEDVLLRRQALDLAFAAMMREAAAQESSRARLHKLSEPAAMTQVRPQLQQQATGTGGADASTAGRLRALQRRAAALTGPDFSSWEGLWASLSSMPSKRLLPLLQVVMTDLYMGRTMAGSPGSAAAAAPVVIGSNSGTSSSNCSNTGRPPMLPFKQQLLSASVQPEEVGQQQDQQQVLSQPEPVAVQQQRGGNTKDVSVQAAETDALLMPNPQQMPAACQDMSTAQSDTAACAQLAPAGELTTAVTADDNTPASARTCTNSQQQRSVSPQREDHNQQQQHHLQHHLAEQQVVGRTSARAGHPIAAGYGVTLQPTHDSSSARLSCSPHSSQLVPSAPASCGTTVQQEGLSPRNCEKQADGKGALAMLASRLSGGGRPEQQSSPVSLAGGKWADIAGGFLGLQSSNNGVVGSGRFIPRGWVQFSGKAAAEEVSSTPGDDAVVDSPLTSGAPAVQQSERGGESFVAPGTPSKAAASITAAAAAAAVASTPRADSATDGAEVKSSSGFDGDDADWSKPEGQSCGNINNAAAVHCTAMSMPAATVP